MLDFGDPVLFELAMPAMTAGVRRILQGMSLAPSGCIDATQPLFARVQTP